MRVRVTEELLELRVVEELLEPEVAEGSLLGTGFEVPVTAGLGNEGDVDEVEEFAGPEEGTEVAPADWLPLEVPETEDEFCAAAL